MSARDRIVSASTTSQKEIVKSEAGRHPVDVVAIRDLLPGEEVGPFVCRAPLCVDRTLIVVLETVDFNRVH